MAFATSNVRGGTVGNLKLVAGDWSGSDAEANAVVPKQVGRTYMANFTSMDSSNGPVQDNSTSVSVSSTNTGAVNINVANRRATTLGRFLIICS